MLRRLAPAVAALIVMVGSTSAQERPEVVVEFRPDTALVSVRGLLRDRRYLRAMQSGFPLYVEYSVQLRESRSWLDRTVNELTWEYVVLYDPVREVFSVEDRDGSEELAGTTELRRRLGRVYKFPLSPDRAGRYHYRAKVTARTLSDEDVDEVFAWLKGENADSARLRRPGFFTRTARRLLVRVAPLPRMTLEGRTESFQHR